MEKSILEKNLEAISKSNPILAKKIANHAQVPDKFQLLEAKTGDIILSYDDIPLHDIIDPQEEAFRIFNNISSNTKSTIHVLFGLGLGYLFKRFTLSCTGKIIVFEPNLDILRITLEIVDFSAEFGRSNIAIVDSKEEIETYFGKFFFVDAEVTLSFLNSYIKIYPEIIQYLSEELGFLRGSYGSAYTNLIQKSYFWTLSGIKNIPYVMENNELESLRGKFNNKPAVIISAGPSLDKNIDMLREYQNNVVTFCVGTASKTAAKHGIIPDFLTVVEHNDCFKQVEGIDVSETNLILYPCAHEKFHNLPAKRKFNYYPNNDYLIKWLAKYINIPLDDYLNRGSVSLCALFSAKILGCNPIILVGQDLAYTNGLCYSQDSAYGDLKCRINPETGKHEVNPDDIENFVSTALSEDNKETRYYTQKRFNEITKSIYFVKGQNGEMLPTDPGYATFKKYFEMAAAEFGSKIKFINATEGGAYIENFEHVPLKSCMENYAKESIHKEEIINEALKNSRNLIREKGRSISKAFDETIRLFEKSASYTNPYLPVNSYNEYKKANCHTLLSKKHIEESLKNYLTLEQNFINQSLLYLGLMLPFHFPLKNYLDSNDNSVIMESGPFYTLTTHLRKFFEQGQSLLKEPLSILKEVRKKLNESCNSAREKSVC